MTGEKDCSSMRDATNFAIYNNNNNNNNIAFCPKQVGVG
jgi:hypothetical protein